MVGISPDAFVILGVFAIGSIALIIFVSLCAVGLFLFVINMVLKRKKVHIPGWANIMAFILLSVALSWALISYYQLDVLLSS